MKATKTHKNIVSLVLGIFLFQLGFGQQVIIDSIMHDDTTRTYRIQVPASYSADTPVPLIIDLHWFGGNGKAEMETTCFSRIADTAGFISVHPDGLQNPQAIPHWSVGHWIGSSSDDVGFLSALIDSLAAEYAIDLDRVYSTGTSNGGFMSFHLACQLCDRIAAIASVAGSMTHYTYDACTPTHPMPILFVHGAEDSVVVVEGNDWSKSVDDVLDYWITHNNCSEVADTTRLPDAADTNSIAVDRIRYGGGDRDVSVEYLKVIGGYHRWWYNDDLNTSIEVWNFFSKYDINGRIGYIPVSLEELRAPSIRCYPNPAQSAITFELVAVNTRGERMIEIFNTQGQLMHKEHIAPAQRSVVNIDIARFINGLYIFRCGNITSKFSVLR